MQPEFTQCGKLQNLPPRFEHLRAPCREFLPPAVCLKSTDQCAFNYLLRSHGREMERVFYLRLDLSHLLFASCRGWTRVRACEEIIPEYISPSKPPVSISVCLPHQTRASSISTPTTLGNKVVSSILSAAGIRGSILDVFLHKVVRLPRSPRQINLNPLTLQHLHRKYDAVPSAKWQVRLLDSWLQTHIPCKANARRYENARLLEPELHRTTKVGCGYNGCNFTCWTIISNASIQRQFSGVRESQN